MKIAYLGQMADVSAENGISKKIRTQAAAWIAAGNTVRYFALAPRTTVWAGLAPLEAEVVRRGPLMVRGFRSRALCGRIRAWEPEVLYFRYAHHSPGLAALFRDLPVVAEINSDDVTEYPLTLSRLKRMYHRLTRERVLRAVRGLVPVTRELGGRFARLGIPTEVIGNSIDLAEYSVLPAPDPANPARLVFLGSAGTPWHGLERIGELAALFPEVAIDVVGFSPADWLRAGAPSPPANVQLHGPMNRDRYEPLLRRATAALGTFGLFRKAMNEACPLKVREYLALGLPVIAAYEDTDVPAEADYFLRLPNDDGSLERHRAAIVEFLRRWRGRRVERSSIQHLDVSIKENLRLAFMCRIASGKSDG